MLLGRAHLARQCASGGESELGGASEDAQSYWQGNPTRGAASGLRKGKRDEVSPLTLFRD